ncbi:MAG TPA: prolyl oligopeptidase family serine peptidase [Chthonomonadaceae bacterium]|nr:prolyl oligopeptidase family serine peptidase [Chthonomonadaceae bacterium]
MRVRQLLVYALLGLLWLALLAIPAGAQHSAQAPRDLSLPTAQPSGNPINDRVWFRFFPAAPAFQRPTPAVILLHSLNDQTNGLQYQFAHYLVGQGLASAVMVLPYHMQRLPPGDNSFRHFLPRDTDTAVQALSQSASDVSTVTSWLERQPEVDARRIGVIGISLGAIVAHLAMGQDDRLTAGVAILGAGNLAHIYHNSLLYRFFHSRLPRLTARERERLLRVDPITYAERNRPRHVLMIQAARDFILPPRDAVALWQALGRPPIRWLDTNHYAPLLAAGCIERASAAYLRAVWSQEPAPERRVPGIYAPTLKLGLLMGLDSNLTFGLQWQALTFAARSDHMSLLHADIGLSGRGPFVGLAVTLTSFLDLGLAHRLNGRTLRPYLSLHLVF